MTDGQKINLLGLDQAGLEQLLTEWGEKPFRARQLMKWMYHRGVSEFGEMTDLAKSLRAVLAERAEIRTPEVVTAQQSADGTRKWLLRMDGSQAIETVFIPEANRGTLCISSQVGCALDCTFCATAQQGFNRNLSPAEIVGQVWHACKELGQYDDPNSENRVITNVVFMGMGEPLTNYQNVVTAIRVLLDDFGFGFSKRRVTVSTSGVVPAMDRLKEDVDVALAVSLHAPVNPVRDRLVPLNKKYPIAELMAACRRYTEDKNRKVSITYEYVMIDGVNDQPEHARQLAKLLRGLPAKLNLIPFNPFPNTEYRRSPDAVIDRFKDITHRQGLTTTVRRTRGDDIDAACGQLAGKVRDRSRRQQRGAAVPTVSPIRHINIENQLSRGNGSKRVGSGV